MDYFTLKEKLSGTVHVAGDFFLQFFSAEPDVDELRDFKTTVERVVVEETTSTDGSSSRLWIVLGMIGALALAMLLMVLGNRRRNALAAQEEVDSPLFEEQYAIHEPDYVEPVYATEDELETEDFAEVVIEAQDFEEDLGEVEIETLPELEPELPYTDPAQAFMDEDGPTEPMVFEPEGKFEPEVDMEEPSRGFTFEQPQEEQPFVSMEDEAVVEEIEDNLAAAYAAEETPVEEAPVEETVDPGEPLRYVAAAAGAGAATVSSGRLSFKGISTDDQSENEQPAEPTSSEENEEAKFSLFDTPEEKVETVSDPQPAMSSSPYIAPIVQADLDRADRNHEARIRALRNDISEQINHMREDNNARLERVVSVLENKIITSLERKIDDIEKRTTLQNESRFAALAPELNAQIDSHMSLMSKNIATQGDRLRAITKVMDDRLGAVGTVYEEVRNSNRRIDDVGTQISRLEKSIFSKATQGDLADVQLSDVVRAAMPPDQYEFKALLPNNHRADCMIRLPHPPGRIVIDTHFPIDAFNALASSEVDRGDNAIRASEDAFRRTILRHIIAISERYIIPGHTADSALLFLPTEAIYTALHARFPDVIHDSFRARVWIVSPSTLMGTLQTLRGVLRDSGRTEAELHRREQSEENMRSEIDRLRSQARALAEHFEETQTDLKSLLEATDVAVDKVAKPASPQSNYAQQDEVKWPSSTGGSSYWDQLTSGETPSDLYPGRKPSDTLR